MVPWVGAACPSSESVVPQIFRSWAMRSRSLGMGAPFHFSTDRVCMVETAWALYVSHSAALRPQQASDLAGAGECTQPAKSKAQIAMWIISFIFVSQRSG